MATLYAWANPLSPASIIGFLDHTWVTDYPFTNGQYPTIHDIPKDGSYWYCWGIYHPSGEGGIHKHPNGAIGSQEGDLTIAKQLVTPNLAPPDLPGDDHESQGGSVFYYAVDGVCHTVANQTLFATGSATQHPMRVLEASGYPLSSFFFTDYGLNSKTWNALKAKYAPGIQEPSGFFEDHLARMGFSDIAVSEIKAIRTVAQDSFTELHEQVPSFSKEKVYALVTTIIGTALYEVRKVVGKDGFLKLFPSFKRVPATAQEASYWIDQQQLNYSMDCIQRLQEQQK